MAEGVEQEIAQLEQQLAEKKRTLETEGGHEQVPTDRELLHEVVGERIQEKMPDYQPASTPAPSDDSGTGIDPAIAQQVQTLVNTAFTGTLDEAIADAIKTQNPAIIDAFHDLLRDQLLDELIKRGKLQAPTP